MSDLTKLIEKARALDGAVSTEEFRDQEAAWNRVSVSIEAMEKRLERAEKALSAIRYFLEAMAPNLQ